MLDVFKKLFESDLFCSGTSDAKSLHLSQTEIDLACAALLIEVAIIDSHFDSSELMALERILHTEFNIAEADISSMIETAKDESTNATSMYQFTRLVNDHCDFEDKFKLVRSMWHIAFADGDLDKYEEYIIRKVSDLLYVSHGDFIRAKIAARSSHPDSK